MLRNTKSLQLRSLSLFTKLPMGEGGAKDTPLGQTQQCLWTYVHTTWQERNFGHTCLWVYATTRTCRPQTPHTVSDTLARISPE